VALKRTDEKVQGSGGGAGAGSTGAAATERSARPEEVALGRVTLKRKRGRPPYPAINPTDALTLDAARAKQQRMNSGHGGKSTVPVRTRSIPVEGIDTYLDHEYLAEERRLRYRPEDFHIAIKNEADHEGEALKVRLHPVMRAALDEMVGCGEFPINSAQDIARRGIYDTLRKLYHLRQAGHKLTNWMSALDAQSGMMAMQEESMAFARTLERLREDVKALVARFGDFGKQQAAVLIVQVRNSAKAMKDRAWGQWYLEKIEEEFGSLVRSQERRVRIKRGGE